MFPCPLMGSARAGTLSDKLSTGLTAMLGNFYSPFSDNKGAPAKKIQYYLYDQLYVSAVGYDATLQGGLFNHSSPYTIAAGDINRLTLQNRYGITIVFKHLYLEYFQSGNTQEFPQQHIPSHRGHTGRVWVLGRLSEVPIAGRIFVNGLG